MKKILKQIKAQNNITKDIRNIFRTKKEINETVIKDIRNRFKLEKKVIKSRVIRDIRNLFRLKKENEAIKNRKIRGIRNLFEHEEVRVGSFWSNSYIENKSISELNKISNKLNHT